MDFTVRKPTHVLAFLLLFGTFLLFIGYPLISVFFPTTIPTIYSGSMSPLQRLSVEMTLLFFQFVFVFFGFIFVPILWYKFVNQISVKEIFERVRLTRKGLDMALLWGFIIIILAFGMTLTIGLVYMYLTNVDPNTLSNIPDLEQLFSLPSLYILVAVQPFCEEFFFRGFLLEKIQKIGGVPLAVILTSILFGISHLSYTYAYAAFIAIFLGILFSSVVIKTKNLYSSIFAHTVINIVSLTLFVFGKSLGM
jgi:membrane protease YdiL (CAAX protease family)